MRKSMVKKIVCVYTGMAACAKITDSHSGFLSRKVK